MVPWPGRRFSIRRDSHALTPARSLPQHAGFPRRDRCASNRFGELVVEARVTGPLLTDAALAALALEHGASVCTTDKDFLRFQGLTVIDPSEL